MPEWELVSGLEVHVQLATKTKLFCSCPTDGFGAPPNSRICPVCTGQPGVLPVLNEEAVSLAFKAALALGARLAGHSIFARKNYFYPDLPKAYQISQYEEPFSQGGGVSFALKDGSTRSVRLERVHMEEDAGKLLHAVGAEELDHSLVDFNRCGTPLIEIVSKPDLRSPDEIHAYLAALKEILQYAGVSRCDMEKGEMRCDANISVRPKGSDVFGTRVEIKNVNSFKNVKDAVSFEFDRQVRARESGEPIVQETRLWNAARAETCPMRSKEEAHDYRYFPDPDLVPLAADPEKIGGLKAAIPELPSERRSRLGAQYKLSSYDVEVLTSDKSLADYFETAAKNRGPEGAKLAANIIMTEVLGRLNKDGLDLARSPVGPEAVAELAGLVESGEVSSKGAKDLLSRMWDTGKSPRTLVSELGLAQVLDEKQIRAWVQEAVAANPRAVEDLKNGKDRAIGAIVGSVMKISKGKANPAVVNKLIQEAVRS